MTKVERANGTGHVWVSPGDTPRGVRKGQTRDNGCGATEVTRWVESRITEVDEITGEKTTKIIPSLRFFYVFNAAQIDGLPAKYYEKAAEHGLLPGAQAVLDDYLATPGSASLHHDAHGKASYSHLTDEIHMPPIGEHVAAGEYYSTAFHEVVHSTGHHTRLARRHEGELRAFGSHEYDCEELCAEMGAAILCAESGVETAQTSTTRPLTWLPECARSRKTTS
jgi:antirestriction protein ArdC